MTLRARLTGAFLAVVLGPVLVGAVLVADTVNAAHQQRERDRLAVAAASLRTAVAATCDRLRAVADAAATLTLSGTRPEAAQELVAQGAAGGVRIEAAGGAGPVTTTGAPGTPWALCAAPDTPGAAGTGVDRAGADGAGVDGVADIQALAAAVPMRDAEGKPAGYAYAAQPLDTAYLAQLAGVAGADVTLLADPARGTGTAGTAGRLARSAAGLGAGAVGEDSGTYLRRVDVTAGTPLGFVVSVPAPSPRGPVLAAAAVVLVAALGAAAAGAALARGTTRPLQEIAEAADRVARGDLDTRVPVRHDDEVGRLGAAFNRMTRETRRYVGALTASRDQLRGNLERLGDTLSATHDLPRILRVTLASAVCATGAQAGLVLLAGDDGALRFHCAEGFDPDTEGRLRSLAVAPGTGLLGAVAATGAASRGRITGYDRVRGDDRVGGTGRVGGDAPDDGRAVSATGEPGCRTYLAVPLRRAPDGAARAGAVHGVLALYDRLGDDDFDDTDLRTVRAFAGHAAVAVDNVRLHEEARRLSHTDALTGLYNYRHLKELLRREVSRAARYGRPLCAVTLDLDRFKNVNDTYGHAAGDAVLVELAHRIGMEIRGVDLAFRAGGEEFVLLLPETDARGGVTLARRLGAAVRGTPFPVRAGLRAAGPEGDDLPGDELGAARRGAGGDRRPDAAVGITVTASVGVAVFPKHGTTGAALLRAADDALYAAKAAGRDTYRLSVVPGSRGVPAVPADDPGLEPAAVHGPAEGEPGAASRGRARPSGGASGGPHPPRQSRGR